MPIRSEGKDRDPTYPPPPPKGLAPVLDRSIEALRQRRLREHPILWGDVHVIDRCFTTGRRRWIGLLSRRWVAKLLVVWTIERH
jgi:hypothetical protein